MAREISSTFYGTSSVHITDGVTSIFVDAFLTRPSFARLVLGRLRSDEAAVDWALHKGGVDKLDAIFVSHSHHDHILDAPAVAERFGARLYGSRSSLNFGKGEGLADELMEQIAGGDSVEIGDFTVRIIEAPHSPGNISPGTIDGELASPCHTLSFKDGGCFVFHFSHPAGNILVLPSANFVPGFLRGLRADVVYLGVGALGRQSAEFQRAYWAETVGELRPRLVIPVHWDHFGRPLSKSLKPIPYPADNVRATRNVLREAARGSGIALHFPQAFDTNTVAAPS
ncbi:MBL fold metallo-hydrolase [Corynebacterium liangguodongii]|uniref:MBL fold metallo-hydrolase n=1 Tax=Corynebacterium liangguodongii TaxID=2079535 RepID=A0A2S0WGV2_9CORY|nr:MBL fold metallo-hydrolase [Corynebacterium liangguodongii]AWB85018.1 MBL fold metallo-hydrolase [Corynebacterium liangguodongii]PWB99562.1 MBL fold metallo-hydrolase [Corynebacterium liangguodongii]